jgi:hypothetical protein
MDRVKQNKAMLAAAGSSEIQTTRYQNKKTIFIVTAMKPQNNLPPSSG